MAIGNIVDRVSSKDIERVTQLQNPPEYEPGYEANIGHESLDDMQFESLLGSDFSTGGMDMGLGGMDMGIGGMDMGIGGLDMGNSLAGLYGLDGGMNNTQPVVQKPDYYEEAFKAIAESSKSLFGVLKELIGTLKNRTADDIAYLGRNCLVYGGISVVTFVVLLIISALMKWELLVSICGSMAISSGLTASYGLVMIGASMMWLENNPDARRTLSDIEDIPDGENNVAEEYSGISDDIMDSLFDNYDFNDSSSDFVYDEEEDLDSNHKEYDFGDLSFDNEKEEEKPMMDLTGIDNERYLDTISENAVMNRITLFNTFKPMLVQNTPQFREKEIIDSFSKEFMALQTICIKALANVAKKEITEINSTLESATKSLFSIELKLERVKSITKTEDIAREIEVYLRETHDDDSVVVTVNIEGDFYKIVATTGENSIITLGDVLQQKEICDFFLNPKNKLPIITGVNSVGKVIYDDAKLFDTMMIAGKPRAGKSWEVLSKNLTIMLFNPPSLCQFCIIDPKRSVLFKTLALMPHVIGLHDDSNVLGVMRDIVENEGERRKKLLNDNEADSIWDLRDKGIELPILYLVIDEIITIKENLGAASGEFDSLMRVMISQLPYLGIRLIFIPHRATGIIDKTNRTMLQYVASVKGDNSDVCDTLDVKNWTHRLVNPGDMAVKTSSMKTPSYLRSVAVTTNDVENAKFIRMVAKAFYKMGVEVPENVCMDVAFNRDENQIRRSLIGDSKVVQYTASNLFKDL